MDKPFKLVPFRLLPEHEGRRARQSAAAAFVGKDRLTDYGRQNIVGLEACLWSETLREKKAGSTTC